MSLQGKVIAITGAAGTMGRALIDELARQGAKPIAITTSLNARFDRAVEVLFWRPGAEMDLRDRFQKIDILVINHGVNLRGDRRPAAIEKSLQVNALSAWSLAEVFLSTVATATDPASKEIWVNTSEAEVSPAFSPLYEVSKRLLGDLITLRRLDAPCVIRKIILGPFKSNLNPIGVMSANWVAWAVVSLAQYNVRNIIVTINPLTYLTFPLKEIAQSLYFRLFSRSTPQPSALTPGRGESQK
ncbi:MAG: bifunctional sterol desaturase/short chain dehydrogenase [Pseudanabaenales cyanobacterium]|nr:bifunctional sterol desaturase/short chain dehydrogenase [Pseudanabaenales cyanobacterium]